MFRVCILLCSLILAHACAPTKQMRMQHDEKKAEMTAQNESFDASTITDFSFPPPPPNTSFSFVRKVTPDELLSMVREKSSNENEEEIDGYRVQLISTRDEEEARAVLRSAVLSFDEQVYREFHDPYYKIRIGDFRSRYDAVLLQEKAIAMGFTEAWVVRSKIKKRALETEKGGSKPIRP